MSRKLRLLLVMLALFAGADLCATRSELVATRSSFGSVPFGHLALFELLRELDLLQGRNLSAPSRLAPGGTIWWIEPDAVCDARIASRGGVDILDPEAVRWPVASWIEAGGTAVVLLEPVGPGRVVCDAIAGHALPPRVRSDAREVWGASLAASRVLELEDLHGFDAALDWQVVARLGDAPFVLERRLGEGRLVVVADAGFVRNAALDRGDSAPLAYDLARAYGALRIDEGEHGFAPEVDATTYLLRSAAAPVFGLLVVLGGLVAWRGNALPARSVVDSSADAPTLESFVASLAALYERTGDHARVLERYRELSAARLRRHFGLPVGVSQAMLAERIEREGRSARSLVEVPVVSSASELRVATRQLDQLVEEVTH